MRRSYSGLLGRFSRGVRGIFTFLTIIPLGGSLEDAAEYFYLAPLVGFTVGLASSPPALIPNVLGPVLALSLTYVLNGFQHMDGYIDFGETLLSRRVGEEALRILKDTHRGSFAIAVAVVTILVASASAISLGRLMIYALPPITSASSLSMFITAYLGRTRGSGLGHMFASLSKRPIKLLWAHLTYVAPLLALTPIMPNWWIWAIVLELALSWICSVSVVKVSHGRLGFINGDVLGFTNELCKSASLVVFAILGAYRLI